MNEQTFAYRGEIPDDDPAITAIHEEAFGPGRFARAAFRLREAGGHDPTLSMVADHIDHVRDVVGIDHIGIGSDYDGMPPGPVGLEDVSTYPNLFFELLKRGYSDEDIKKIAGLNVLRVMREAEKVAARLQQERPPSDATLEELDTAGEMMVPAER